MGGFVIFELIGFSSWGVALNGMHVAKRLCFSLSAPHRVPMITISRKNFYQINNSIFALSHLLLNRVIKFQTIALFDTDTHTHAHIKWKQTIFRIQVILATASGCFCFTETNKFKFINRMWFLCCCAIPNSVVWSFFGVALLRAQRCINKFSSPEKYIAIKYMVTHSVGARQRWWWFWLSCKPNVRSPLD